MTEAEIQDPSREESRVEHVTNECRYALRHPAERVTIHDDHVGVWYLKASTWFLRVVQISFQVEAGVEATESTSILI